MEFLCEKSSAQQHLRKFISIRIVSGSRAEKKKKKLRESHQVCVAMLASHIPLMLHRLNLADVVCCCCSSRDCVESGVEVKRTKNYFYEFCSLNRTRKISGRGILQRSSQCPMLIPVCRSIRRAYVTAEHRAHARTHTHTHMSFAI